MEFISLMRNVASFHDSPSSCGSYNQIDKNRIYRNEAPKIKNLLKNAGHPDATVGFDEQVNLTGWHRFDHQVTNVKERSWFDRP